MWEVGRWKVVTLEGFIQYIAAVVFSYTVDSMTPHRLHSCLKVKKCLHMLVVIKFNHSNKQKLSRHTHHVWKPLLIYPPPAHLSMNYLTT